MNNIEGYFINHSLIGLGEVENPNSQVDGVASDSVTIICPSFQTSGEEPHVLSPHKLPNSEATLSSQAVVPSHTESLWHPHESSCKAMRCDGVCINHSQFFRIWQC